MRTRTVAGMLLASALASPPALPATDTAPGVQATLDTAEIATLVFLREEEKLARDLYVTFGARWNVPIFDNIADAEQRHMDALEDALARWGVPDPVVDDAVGAFTDPAIAADYAMLAQRGEASLLEAFLAAGFVEEADVAALRLALDGTDEPDLDTVYGNLLDGTTQHLRAFVSHVEALGVAYVAQVLEQADLDALMDGASHRARLGHGGWAVDGHPGEGMIFDVAEDGTFLMTWFTYDTAGNPFWMLGTAPPGVGEAVVVDLYHYHGPVFGSGYDPAALAEEPWGQATVTFHDCMHGTVAWWSVGGVGEYAIERLYFTGGSACGLD